MNDERRMVPKANFDKYFF